MRINGSNASLSDLEAKVPETLRDSVEVVHALYSQGIQSNQLDFAERKARRIIELDSDNLRHGNLLASVLLNIVGDAKKGHAELPAVDIDKKIREAIQLLDPIVNATDLPCISTVARARYLRGFANTYLNNDGDAEADFRESLRLNPKDRDTAYQLGLFLMTRNRVEAAIEIFRKCAIENNDPAPLLLLCRLLVQRNQTGDLKSAAEMLESEIVQLPEFDAGDQFDFVDTLCRAYRKIELTEKAIKLLETVENILDECSVTTLRSEMMLSRDRTEEASKLALDAKNAIGEKTPIGCLHFLAQLLGQLKQFSASLEVFKRFIKPSGYADLMNMAVDCAIKCKDHKFILEFCRKLRATGNATPFTLEMEIGALEVHSEFATAIEIIDGYLADPKDDELAACLRVRRSVFGIRLGKPELIERDLNNLPKVDVVPAKFGCIVASVLKEGRCFEKAANYVYQLLRSNWNEPEVHRCIATLFGIGEDADFKFDDHSLVQGGSAVRFRETGRPEDEWIVIEDEYEPQQALNEVSPSSTRGKELLGKQVGDTFYLRKDSIQDRTAEITAIVHKFTYRQHDCFQGFEDRFPNDFLGYSYQIPKLPNGELDIGSFLESLKKVDQPIEELDRLTKKSLITPTSYAKIANRSILETVCHFTSSEDLPIRCCRGTDYEFAGAEEALSENGKIVADPSAIATLFVLAIHKHLDSLPSRFLISAGTLDLFRRIAQDPSGMFAKRRMGTIRGRMFLREFSDDELNAGIENFREFYRWIESNFETRGGIGKADIPLNKRNELETIFGDATVESIGVASQESAVLWTDDFAVAEMVQDELIAQRVWTDVLFEFFAKHQIASPELLTRIKLRLVDFGYVFTRLNNDSTKLAFKESNFDSTIRPLSSVVNWLHSSGIVPIGAFQHSAFMLRHAWNNAPLGHQPLQFTSALCRSLAKRTDGVEVLVLLKESLIGNSTFVAPKSSKFEVTSRGVGIS